MSGRFAGLPLAEMKPVSRVVRTRVRQLLGVESVDLPSIAAVLHISPRTLQRRLAQESASFEQLVDSVRDEEATLLLTHSTIRIIDIAIALGYGEHASFTRAFRRRTGKSPREYRHGVSIETQSLEPYGRVVGRHGTVFSGEQLASI